MQDRSMLKGLHNRFRHVEPYLGLFIGAGFFSWVSKEARVFGVDTWAEAVLLGSAFGFVAMFALAALLVGWRYFSPTKPTSEPIATDAAIPPYDDAWIREALQILEQKVASLEATNAPLPEHMADAFRFNDPQWLTSRFLVENEQDNLARRLSGALEEIETALQDIRTDGLKRHPNFLMGRVGDVAKRVHLLGIDQERVNSTVKHAADAIRGNAKYLHIKDDEKDVWRNEESKQEWHVYHAEVAALKSLIRERKMRVVPQEILLEKLAEVR